MPRSNGETANREPAHDMQEILEHITSHVDVRLSAPMSSSVLRLHTAPRAHSGPAAGGSFGGAVAGLDPQLPRATHSPQTRFGTAAVGASRGTAAWSRPCVVADGVVMQSGYPVRPMDVPN